MRQLTCIQRISCGCSGAVLVAQSTTSSSRRFKQLESCTSFLAVLLFCSTLLASYCLPNTAFADSQVSLDLSSLNGRENLSPQSSYAAIKSPIRNNSKMPILLSPQDVEKLPEILKQADLNWRRNDSQTLKLKQQAVDHWVRVSLNNSSDASKTLILSFEYAPASVLSLFEYDPQTGSIQKLSDQLGLLRPFNDRAINYRYLANQVTLPAHSQREYYWNIFQSNPINFQIAAWSPEAFRTHLQQEQIAFGIVYGMLIMLSIYNLFVYFTTKQKAHLYFVLLSLLVLPTLASMEGHLYQLIAADSSWPKRELLMGLMATQQPAFALFASHFLNLRERTPLFYRGFIVFSLICMAHWCYFLLGLNSVVLIKIAELSNAILYISAAVVATYLALRGDNSARFFLFSLCIGAFCFFVMSLDYASALFAESFKILPVTSSYIAMILMFSIALAGRIKHIQDEKIAASLELVKLTEDKLKSNAELYRSKMQQMELEKRADEARIENRAKSEFLATMSHEIRTPMSGVLGMTELLKDTDLSNTQERYVTTIYNSGQALLNVINDLLDYSKIEAGKMQLESVTFNLDELVDDCISIFALKATEKNINFIGSIKPGTENFLKGDPTKLQQVILNLLSNAFKFTESGDVTLYVYPTSKTSINSIELRFEVKDTGIGLSLDGQDCLFDPFSQADVSTARKYGGTGLGLAICKQLAELMNGTIGVNSEPGKGSTFWFTARLLIPKSEERPVSEPIHPALAGKRILIYDEHPAFLDACLIITSSWDMRVSVSSSATDTLQQLRDSLSEAHPVDFLIAPISINPTAESFFSRVQHCLQETGTLVQPKLIATTTTRRLDKNFFDLYSLSGAVSKPLTKKLLKECLLNCLGIKEQDNSNVAERPIYNFDHLNVLVAEDNKVNAMVIEGLLNKLRVYPTIVEDGAKAFAAIAQNDPSKPFDLIFMDCEMPIMDGYHATQQIRQLEATERRRPIIIVGLSAHASSEYQERAMDAGMDDYITKPVNKGGVETVLKKFFAHKGSVLQFNIAG